ncbi:hypothetical protein AAC387_Pa04g0274 [Persea americana]
MSIGNGKALRLHSDTDAASPLLAWAVSSHFQVFLHSERRKTGSWTFTAALIGGKAAIASFPPLRGEENWQLQLYRRSHRRFTAALIGGKVDFPVFLRSEGRKTGNCGYAAGTYGARIFKYSSTLRGGKLAVGPLPPPSSAVKLQLPASLRSEGRKTGSCSFTAALIGGKVDFPVFLLSERRKAGNCRFTAALIGGKVDFPVFLRSEGRKTGNCGYAAGTYGARIFKYSSTLRGGKLAVGPLPPPSSAVKLQLPASLRSEGRKTGSCSFTAALIGGKVDFPVFLLSERRKAGNCRFTAALIGGKVDFPVFLRSEGRKTGNCGYAAGTYGARIFKYSSTLRGGKLAVGPLPPPSSAVKLQLPASLRSEGRKTGSCSFTAALIGGKVDFPVFLLSERRKAGNCRFTAALIGGKVDFPVFLRSEGRKTGNCGYAAGTYGARIFKYSSTLRGGKLAVGPLPPPSSAVKLQLPASLRSEGRKTGSCSFTAALIGGKVDFPVFLLSERRKAGNCRFTAALIGGKVDFPVFLRSEGRKTGNCGYAAGTYGARIFKYSSTLRGGKLAVGPLPPPSSAVKLQLPASLRSEGRKTGSCSFTAALIGGKVDFPVFLLSERRKAGNCRFTAALIGGKVDFPVFLRSEGRKTGNCGYAAGTYGARIFKYSSTLRGGKLAVGPLPPPSSAVKLQLPAFLRSEGRKTGSCSFTAALIGGKVDFPVFLLSERRKAGNCRFTAALIGGKVDFPVFLRSEGRKTGNCGYAAGTYGARIFKYSSTLRGGKLAVGPLPPPSSAVKLQLPAFLRSEGRKTGSCSFTAALIGGKVDFPVFLLSERRKAGNCRFTAALIGGKVDFPVFLRSEGRKTGNCGYAAGTYGGESHRRSLKSTSDERFMDDGAADRSKLHQQSDIPDFIVSL